LLATICAQVLWQATAAPAHWPLMALVDHQMPLPNAFQVCHWLLTTAPCAVL
jgi:hypothetical protein